MNKYYQKAIPFGLMCGVFIVILIYLAFSFGFADLNFTKWSSGSRGIFAGISVVLFLLFIFLGVDWFSTISKKDKENS